MAAPLASADVLPVDVTPQTCWIFVRLTDAEGVVGLGEATLGRRSVAVVEAARGLGAMLIGETTAEAAIARLPRPHGLVEAAAVSAVDQALHDIAARRAGLSVAALIRGEARREIGLYANINRRTRDRSPAGFAASARDALAQGYGAFKIAPFDEITPAICGEAGFSAALAPGLARVAAVRAAIGPERRLMLDCHWRFTEARAREAIDACAGFGLHWFECPIDENRGNLPAIARLRAHAHRRDMLLAGGETLVGMAELTPLLDAGAYDVIMPDVKYVGGLAEMLRMADAQSAAGVAFSPHNPTGPVAHAASLEVCAAVAGADLLEHQFDETPLFEALAAGSLPPVHGGVVALAAGRRGLGVRLDGDLAARLAAPRE